MTQKWLQLFREIQSATVRPMYVLAGEETFQIEEAIAAIRSRILGHEGDSNDFLLEIFDGESVEGSSLLSAVQRLPGLFDSADSKRLVLCRRFDKAPAAVVESLHEYWQDPNPATVFVITVSKLDKRKSWVRHAEEKGFVLETHEPFDREWPKWQTYLERKVGKKFEPGAWEALVAAAGHSLSTVWMESQKLACYVGEDTSIPKQSVDSVVGSSRESDIFAFCEDVANGALLEANLKFRGLMLTGESEIKLAALLIRLFRQVRICRSLLDRGIQDPRVVASEAGIPPFVVPKRLQQARASSLAHLDRVLALLADLDYRLKVGKGSMFENFLAARFGEKGPSDGVLRAP